MKRPSQLPPLPDQMEVVLTIEVGDEESPFQQYSRTFIMPSQLDDPEWDKVNDLLDLLVKHAEDALDKHDRT